MRDETGGTEWSTVEGALEGSKDGVDDRCEEGLLDGITGLVEGPRVNTGAADGCVLSGLTEGHTDGTALGAAV